MSFHVLYSSELTIRNAGADNPDLLVEIEVQPSPDNCWHEIVQCDGDAELLEKNLEPLSLTF